MVIPTFGAVYACINYRFDKDSVHTTDLCISNDTSAVLGATASYCTSGRVHVEGHFVSKCSDGVPRKMPDAI
eukprot:11334425-Ditylum_brightwellii.AAC.1